jgi:hypothetical protein
VSLFGPRFRAARCKELAYARDAAANGKAVRGVIHNSIHKLAP